MTEDHEETRKVEKTEEEWRAELTEEQYRVARLGGTEAPFSGELENHEGVGSYRCVCCGEELFRSGAKFHSGSGWPSFTVPAHGRPLRPGMRTRRRDLKRVAPLAPAVTMAIAFA